MAELKPEHGTLQAYITGFVLSLIFTLIPYYLVVHHTFSGRALLITILGFGVLQMLVQLLFFLHIGRRPRPTWQIHFLNATVGAILVVVGGSIVITTNLHHNMMPTEQALKLVNDEGIYQVNGEKTGACQGQYPNHQIIIKDGVATPSFISAKQCDTLTYITQDGRPNDIVFTQDAKTASYAGVASYSVRKGQNQTITLSELGTYQFHDSAQPATAGSFTVSN